MAKLARRDAPAQVKRKWPRVSAEKVLIALSIALLTLLVLASPPWPAGNSGSRQLSAEIGYRAAVDKMAREGLFKRTMVERPGQPPLIRVQWDKDAIARVLKAGGDCRTLWERQRFLPWFVADPRGPCEKRLMTYASRSYLDLDMRQINRWQLEDNGVAGLQPTAHVLIAAGGPRKIWEGVVNYRGESAGKAKGYDPAQPMLVLSEVGGKRAVFRFARGRAKAEFPVDQLFAGEFDGGEASRVVLALESRVPGSPFQPTAIALVPLGRALLVEIPSRLGTVQIYIDGRLVAKGEAGKAKPAYDNVRYWLIRPDQFLTIEGQGGRKRTLQLAETPGSISELSAGRRIREPSLRDVSQWFEQSGIEGGDFESSIVGRMHLDLQRRLAVRMTADNAPGSPPRFSYRGAALMMDGLTGEIAAAATFPTEVNQLAMDDREDSTRLNWLRTNMNFRGLTIGSAAKVPFAAAVTDRYPDLLKLVIPYRPVFHDVDGHQLMLGDKQGIENAPGHRGDGKVDFNAFLTFSNNEYALVLAKKGVEHDERTGQSFSSERSWAANLWRFGCVIPYGIRPGAPDLGWDGTTSHCSPHLWRDADNQPLGSNAFELPRLNLMMGLRDNDFIDFYLSVIGGNRSLWSTANLGQAYARILSGRGISPRLTPAKGDVAPDTVAMHAEAWREIRDAMSNVVQKGTAKQLWKLLAQPQGVEGSVFFFAKTGTADVDQPAKEQGHILVLMAVRTSTGALPARPSQICGLKVLVINLQRRTTDALAFAAELLTAPDSAYLRWMTTPCRAPAPGN